MDKLGQTVKHEAGMAQIIQPQAPLGSMTSWTYDREENVLTVSIFAAAKVAFSGPYVGASCPTEVADWRTQLSM